MAVRNNDFTNIYRDARADFALRGVSILASAMSRLSTVDARAREEFADALATLSEAATWGNRTDQASDLGAIQGLFKRSI